MFLSTRTKEGMRYACPFSIVFLSNGIVETDEFDEVVLVSSAHTEKGIIIATKNVDKSRDLISIVE